MAARAARRRGARHAVRLRPSSSRPSPVRSDARRDLGRGVHRAAPSPATRRAPGAVGGGAEQRHRRPRGARAAGAHVMLERRGVLGPPATDLARSASGAPKTRSSSSPRASSTRAPALAPGLDQPRLPARAQSPGMLASRRACTARRPRPPRRGAEPSASSGRAVSAGDLAPRLALQRREQVRQRHVSPRRGT